MILLVQERWAVKDVLSVKSTALSKRVLVMPGFGPAARQLAEPVRQLIRASTSEAGQQASGGGETEGRARRAAPTV